MHAQVITRQCRPYFVNQTIHLPRQIFRQACKKSLYGGMVYIYLLIRNSVNTTSIFLIQTALFFSSSAFAKICFPSIPCTCDSQSSAAAVPQIWGLLFSFPLTSTRFWLSESHWKTYFLPTKPDSYQHTKKLDLEIRTVNIMQLACYWLPFILTTIAVSIV